MRYTFDRFELDSELHRLQGPDGSDVALRPQAFKVLEYLVRRAPSVVSRDELLKGVWGHNALCVSGVSQAIREIRRALCDDAAQPRIIATRHGCGYQVVTRVVVKDAPDDSSSLSAEPPRQAPGPLGTTAVFALLLVGLVAGAYWFGVGTRAFPTPEGQSLPVFRDLAGASIPVDSEARTAFSNGELFRQEMNWVRAIESYTRSIEFEPGSSAALLGLVDAYFRAGHETRARELIARPALQLGALSRRGQLEVRAQLARLSGDWEEVVHCMRSLAEFFPGNLEYQFGLFEALLASASPERARPVLDRIRRMLPDENPGARYYLALHSLSERANQPAEALAASRLAAEAAIADEQDLLYAHAELALGRSLDEADHPTASREAFVRAARSMQSGFDEAGHARALLELARLDLRQNRLEDVRTHLNPACVIFSSIGSGLGMARCNRVEGELLAATGKAAMAESMLAQSAENFERGGRALEAGETHALLADLKLEMGDLSGAEHSIRRARHLFDRLGDRAGYARARLLRGTLLQHRDKPVESLVALRDAYTVFQGIGERAGEAAAAARMAASFSMSGNHARAAEHYDEAITLLRTDGHGGRLADVLFDAGMLAQRDGRLKSAEDHLAEAAQIHAALGNDAGAALAFSELARVHIDQARSDAARDALARAARQKSAGAGQMAIVESVSGYLALLECDRDAAEWHFTSARTLRESLNDDSELLRSHLDQARLSIERGDPSAAEKSARHILDHGDAADRSGLIAEAYVVLVDALMLQEQFDEARRTLGNMNRAGLTGESGKVELAYQILLGKLNMVNDPARHLRNVRDRANASGYRLMAMETDVALAYNLLGRGIMGEGREIAAAVMESAKQSGMLYVAERAMKLGSVNSRSGLPLAE